MKSVRACATAAEGPWLLAPMHAAGLLAAVYTADEPGATAGGEPAGRIVPLGVLSSSSSLHHACDEQ